jgi:hypothetical protein
MNLPRWRKRTSVIRSAWRFGLVGVLFFLPALAQAQSELNNPYKLHIVVHVAPNRLLTDVFRDRIERDLHDGFQAALGDMARVKVDHHHDRLKEVLERGLKEALNGWKDRSDGKTHFVLIDYSGVHYEIQTRQYDGSIGRASPVVRHARTRDRDFVAKAAALLIKQDFGILGTVKSGPEGASNQVKIELRGGGLGDMSRWVKKDEVFALAPPGGGTSASLNWAVLQVEEPPDEKARDGICKCRFFHRYQVPSIVGYRCIKLGTVQTPLRLRWMKQMPDRKLKPLDLPLTVDIRRHGFEGEDATRLRKSVDHAGALDTLEEGDKGVFSHVAFVRVTDGMDDPKPQVPIPLVDDQLVFIEVNAAKDTGTLFAVNKLNWQNSVADCLQMQANLFKRLEMLGAKAEQRNEVIQEAQRGLKRLQADRTDLVDQKRKLAEDAKKNNKELKTPLEDRRLRQIQEYERALADFIKEQEKIEATENDPQLKKWRSEWENAKLLEKDLEFGKAIAIYEKIQKEGFKDEGLNKHLKELKDLWKVANEDHRKARDFIYRVWPTILTARLEDNIPKAEKALKICEDAGDLVSIQKLLKGCEGHADRLTKELRDLHPDLITTDVQPAKQLTKISNQLQKLFEDISEYLRSKAPDS